MDDKKTWLHELVEISGYEDPDIYKELGFHRQGWSYRKQNADTFPVKLLPALIYYSGLEDEEFLDLIFRHFPVK